MKTQERVKIFDFNRFFSRLFFIIYLSYVTDAVGISSCPRLMLNLILNLCLTKSALLYMSESEIDARGTPKGSVISSSAALK